MKKLKKGVKSSSSKTVKSKKSVVSLVKKTAKSLLVKMTAKAKKPQVKVPSKPAKGAVKNTAKAPLKATSKVSAKDTSKKSKPAPVLEAKGKKGKPATPAKALPQAKELNSKTEKKGAKAPAPVVAAVLTKTSGKASKTVKPHVSSERMCREASCENVATTKGYCRLDYIKNWKKIKRKEMILKEGKLNQYIEELVSKYPDKYIDVIRQDLSTEMTFNKVIHDLELDESIDDLDYDGDSIDALIGGIKKDIEDFGDEEF